MCAAKPNGVREAKKLLLSDHSRGSILSTPQSPDCVPLRTSAKHEGANHRPLLHRGRVKGQKKGDLSPLPRGEGSKRGKETQTEEERVLQEHPTNPFPVCFGALPQSKRKR